MRKMLLAVLVLCAGRLAAQISIPAQVVSCTNGYAVFRGSGNFWQASYDNGQTWSTTIIGGTTVADNGFLDLDIDFVSPVSTVCPGTSELFTVTGGDG